MRIDEMFNSAPAGYHNEEDDNTPLTLSDMRKTKITLMQLNRLRVMDDVRSFEQEKKKEEVQTQYKSASDTMPSM
jgi:3'-phosphoadenosine 5'-phosphosulfate (PAPS) 3'-phosphatase